MIKITFGICFQSIYRWCTIYRVAITSIHWNYSNCDVYLL